MNGFYEQCILPEPFTILGRDLKPFSFGHYILLRRFGVGFVKDEATPYTLEDLVFSILICSFTFEEASDLLNNRKFQSVALEWGKSLRAKQVAALKKQFSDKSPEEIESLADKADAADLTLAAYEWNHYLAVHTIRMNFTPKKVKGNAKLQEQNEWYEDVLTAVQKDKGYTDTQKFNYPFCRILYEYHCYLKRNALGSFGDLDSIFKEREKAYREKLAAQAAQEK